MPVQGSSIATKLRDMQPIGRACAMRALAACMSVPALCAPAVLTGPAAGGTAAPQSRPWHLLVDGLVEEAAATARESSDAQLTFNSIGALTACLERAAWILQRPPRSEVRAARAVRAVWSAVSGWVHRDVLVLILPGATMHVKRGQRNVMERRCWCACISGNVREAWLCVV